MKKHHTTAVIVFFALQLIHAQGTTYLSNLGQSSTGSLAVGSDSWLAVDFTTGNNAGGYLLDSVQLAMADASGNPNGFTVMIYNALVGSGITPGDSLGTLNGSDNPSTAGIYTYTPTTDVMLSSHTIYFIVLTTETVVANGAYNLSYAATFSYNPSGGWAVGNDESSVAVFHSSHNGLSWIGNDGNLQFALNATAIPEPSASWLLLLGGGVLFYVRRTFNR
jgi:PEP-CTERM motif